MVLKMIVPVVIGAALIAGSAALAADYGPNEFLSLNLAKAVLSPTLLGPEAHFEPFPIEASSDAGHAESSPAVTPDVSTATAKVPAAALPHVRVAGPLAKPRGAARILLAHRHGNPMDAQAMDTRGQARAPKSIQTWPCKPGSGGICSWK